MFNRDLKARMETLEAELAAVKDQITELKINFGHLTGENHFLREQNDLLKSFGIVPGKEIRRREYPDYTEEGNASQDGL